VRPLVSEAALPKNYRAENYRATAADEAREREANEWS
jgi:hypothetical protein